MTLRMTFSTMTLSITSFDVMTPIIMTLQNDTQLNDAQNDFQHMPLSITAFNVMSLSIMTLINTWTQ